MTYLHCNWKHDDNGKLEAHWYQACHLPESYYDDIYVAKAFEVENFNEQYEERYINDTEFGDFPLNDFNDHLEIKYGEDAYSIDEEYIQQYWEFDR